MSLLRTPHEFVFCAELCWANHYCMGKLQIKAYPAGCTKSSFQARSPPRRTTINIIPYRHWNELKNRGSRIFNTGTSFIEAKCLVMSTFMEKVKHFYLREGYNLLYSFDVSFYNYFIVCRFWWDSCLLPKGMIVYLFLFLTTLLQKRLFMKCMLTDVCFAQ